ncbi:MAG: glycosyltransferase family 4 protein [Nitrospirota bacterium]
MRIALVRKRFVSYGGAENYLWLLSRLLIKEGFDVHIFANRWVDEKGLTFHNVPVWRGPSSISNLTFALNCEHILKKWDMDVIISFERTFYQDIYRAGDGCHREWLEQRKKIYPFYKRYSDYINPLHAVFLYIEKRIFTDMNLKMVITNSKMVKTQIAGHYRFPEDRIVIIYNGVDLGRFNPSQKKELRKSIREYLGFKEDDFVIIFVGSGFRRKGLDTLLRAVSRLKNTNTGFGRPIRLLIVGKDEPRRYKSMAGRLGILENLSFIPQTAMVEELYLASDIFALPTFYDPFSNATLEAMACGLPVITTSYNGASEIMTDGKEGFILSDPSDAEGLSERILFVSEPERLIQMGMAARQTAEKYPIEDAVQSFIRVVREINV